MTRFRSLAPVAAAAVLTASALLAIPTAATAQAVTRQAAPAVTVQTQQQVFIENQDARETRDALMAVLKRYPPSFSYILKLDPTLMANPSYLAPYPALAQFLQQHPEVARSPRYFFEQVYNQSDWRPDGPVSERDQAINMWRNTIEGFTFLLGFLSVLAGLVWVIKSVVDHRRWGRQAKVQAEVHNKLIDRLASNDEMLAYIQSPAGAGFLKGGPPVIGGPSVAQSMHAPFGRILWSAQAGVVLLALGTGFRWVHTTGPNEVAEMLAFFGLVGQALGVGFLASAVLAYVLSRQMGLIESAAAVPTERDTPTRS